MIFDWFLRFFSRPLAVESRAGGQILRLFALIWSPWCQWDLLQNSVTASKPLSLKNIWLEKDRLCCPMGIPTNATLPLGRWFSSQKQISAPWIHTDMHSPQILGSAFYFDGTGPLEELLQQQTFQAILTSCMSAYVCSKWEMSHLNMQKFRYKSEIHSLGNLFGLPTPSE